MEPHIPNSRRRSSISDRLLSLPMDLSSGATSHGLCEDLSISESHRKVQGEVRAQGKSCGYTTMIDMLPDDVLLDILDFHRIIESGFRLWSLRLAHVCRQWRQIIFASPHRLHIQLRCTYGTPVRRLLGCWPAFPIDVDYDRGKGIPFSDEDNILAALEHSDRVCRLALHIRAPQLAKLVTVIRKPFPVLTNLQLSVKGWDPSGPPVLPSGSLGGSAPCLQELYIRAVLFQELPTFLSSARDLVTLHLPSIPPADYISPEVMVACLATSTKLRYLYLGFQWDTSPHGRIDPATVTRTVLPALTYFEFQGVCDYVEDLVARIDCPCLNGIDLSYLEPSFGFQVSEIFKFINRSEDPQLTLFDRVDVRFDSSLGRTTTLKFSTPHHIPIYISLIGQDLGQVFQVFSQLTAKLSNVRHLFIDGSWRQGPEIGRAELVQFLHQFTTTQTLHVSQKSAKRIALALKSVDGEMAAKLLPALDLLCLEDQPVSSVAKFCAVRRLSGRPVTFFRTKTKFWEFSNRLQPYLSE
ncbi:hypothetical protein EDB89DRAFT_112310 [Lactarius sanguifluus]|nr:hypothetical protein EDB89DRAFT_112310 [Lactarius sanguifluus]